MALTELEKDWVTQLVINTANATAERVGKEIIDAHVQACPYGRSIMRWVYTCIGVGIGVGLVLGIGGREVVVQLITLFKGV